MFAGFYGIQSPLLRVSSEYLRRATYRVTSWVDFMMSPESRHFFLKRAMCKRVTSVTSGDIMKNP